MLMSRRGRKAQPFSIRLRTEDDRFVADEARRLKRPRGAIVEEYATEAITTRRYPGIGFRGDDYRRRAWLIGTGLDVWEIVALTRDFGDERELASGYGLTLGQIRIALAYYDEFTDEIDALIARGRRSEQELLTRYPFIESWKDTAAGGGP
jgi:uncharacterized protein (DUF433 family)